MKKPSTRFQNIRAKAARRCAAAPRLLAPVFAALALLIPALSACADAPDFRFRPLLAGNASLTEPHILRAKRTAQQALCGVRHGDEALARDDAPSGTMRGGVAWG